MMTSDIFKNKLLEREKILHGLKDMKEPAMMQLLQELKLEHQKLYFQETAEPERKNQETWHRLVLENERQQTIINQYNSTQFQKLAKSTEPKVPWLTNALKAFAVGGLICVLGQLVINYLIQMQGLDFKIASGLASVTIVVITGVLTGFGIYDEVGRFGGAGSMVPISGFANSIVSAALEFKREGMVYGIGAKIFTVAGPVILYGSIAAVLVGLVKFLMM